MKIRGVRFRLTIWYSLVLISTTAVIFSSFFFVTRRTLYRQLDDMLASHSNKLLEVLREDETDLHQVIAKQVFIQEFSQIPGELVVIMNKSGEIISSSISQNPDVSQLLPLFTTAVEEGQSYFQNQPVGSFTMRFFVQPVVISGQIDGVALVGSPLNVIEQSLQSLYALLMIVFVILIIPTIVGGYFLSGRAMIPIVEISNKLQHISSYNLKERVKIPKTGDEIETLANTFNRLLDRLDSAFRRERQFIGDVAHELKTPLASLKSGIEVVLSKRRTNQEYKNEMKEVLVDINKLNYTIRDLLDLAWSKADQITTNFDSFSLSESMNDVLDVSRKIALNKNINIQASVKKGVAVRGNQAKLCQAILNIIDNAVKYSNDKKKVFVSLKTSGRRAIIRIKDSGKGIPESELSKIFDRFFRGSNASEIQGSGLGLSIAQAIITAHRGKIDVTSKIGRGTTFKIRLPLA